MRKPFIKYKDAIFIITGERSCPIYNIGDEFKVENLMLSLPPDKPSCLRLSEALAKVMQSADRQSGPPRMGFSKPLFDCGGCSGVVHFEFKKDRDFATVQMKLLTEAEDKKKREHLENYFNILRKLDIFESLEDDALSDLTVLLEFTTIHADKVVLRKGEAGSNLYIILSGEVEVIGEDNERIAEIGDGEIFGEMSLLSGEPVTSSIYTVSDTQVAKLSAKNFKYVLKKHPILKLFLFKLLVARAQTLALRAGNIISGMSGRLTETPVVSLLELIHETARTGRLDLIVEQGKGMVFFKDGEIVHVRFLDFRNAEALGILLRMNSGRFVYTKGIPQELAKSRPIGSFEQLVIDFFQRIEGKKDKRL